MLHLQKIYWYKIWNRKNILHYNYENVVYKEMIKNKLLSARFSSKRIQQEAYFCKFLYKACILYFK